MALELHPFGSAHAVECKLADYVATGQELRRVRTCSRLFCHGTNEDVMEMEGRAQIDLTWQLSCCLEVLFDDSSELGEFRNCVGACFNSLLQW